MTVDQIIFMVIGVALILFGFTKIGINGRRAQRWVRLIGETPTRILYIVLGIAFIVVAFIVDLSNL